MQMNNFIRLLKLTLVSVVAVVLLASCASDVKNGKPRQVDKSKSLELHIKLAQGYIDKGNRESARHHLRKASEIDKNSADAMEAMGRLYQLEGEPVLAEETFKKAINELTIYESGDTEIKDTINIRKTRPFVVNESEFYIPDKSVFNIIAGDSTLELKFASFLDSCPDVISFGKNYFAVNFKLDYLNADGNISYYYPDFLVKVKPKSAKEELFVVETKGREDLDDPLKIKRLRQWCHDVNAIPGAKQIWNFVYVTENEFKKYRDNLKSFSDVVSNFDKFHN